MHINSSRWSRLMHISSIHPTRPSPIQSNYRLCLLPAPSAPTLDLGNCSGSDRRAMRRWAASALDAMWYLAQWALVGTTTLQPSSR